VLFLVQPGERNVMDQRHLEYELIARSGGCGGLAPSSAATSGAPTPAGAPVLPELQGAPVHVLRATLTDVSTQREMGSTMSAYVDFLFFFFFPPLVVCLSIPTFAKKRRKKTVLCAVMSYLVIACPLT